MDDNKSYKIGQTTGTIEEEHKRLLDQVHLYWDQEEILLHTLEIPTKPVIVDIGSGPGFIMQKLSELFDRSTIIGVDVDDTMIGLARSNLEGMDNVELRQGSIYDLPIEDESVDLAYARLIFMHLNDPARALEEICRVLKPNGYVVILDTDDGIDYITDPHVPEVRKLIDIHMQIQKQLGGDRLVVRKLPKLLSLKNFRNVQIFAMVKHTHLAHRQTLMNAIIPRRVLDLLREKKLINEEEYTVLDEFDKNVREGSMDMMIQLYFVHAQK